MEESNSVEEDSEKGGMNSELSCKKSTSRKVVAAYQNLSNIVSLPKVGLETQSPNSADESDRLLVMEAEDV